MKEKIRHFFHKAKQIITSAFSKIGAFIKKHKVLSIIIALILIIAIVFLIMLNKGKQNRNVSGNEARAERMTISESITGSSTVSANNEYSVTSLVSGEILTAPFEEGDMVQKDQVLYTIDSSDMENNLKSAALNVEKARDNYTKAQNAHTDSISQKTRESNDITLQNSYKNYDDAMKSYKDLFVSSEISGVVTNLYVSVGDTVNNGAKIADVVNNNILKADIPFNESDAAGISVGDAATVTLVSTGDILYGTVTAVSSGSQTGVGNMRISTVSVQINNPGAVNEGESVTAFVNSYACNDIGKLEASEKRTVCAKVPGTISELWAITGDYISAGSTVAVLDSDTVESQLQKADNDLRSALLKNDITDLQSMDAETYASNLKNAKRALDEAQIAQDKINKQLEDYTIKSPIAGTVVRKNKKAGEKIGSGSGSSSAGSSMSASASSSSGSSSNVLVIIYDMSSLNCELAVDELDIKKISVGQQVKITADAVSGKTYTGEVENVSINGTVGTGGVTTYPVKVKILDFDDSLLPGMNVDLEITVAQSENTLAIPLLAVNRGNTVYVKGDKTDEKDKAPEGYKTVRVETGISNESFVEIKSGLNEGDTIYVPKVESLSPMQSMMQGMHGGSMGGGMSGGGMQGGNRSGGMPGGGMQGGNRSGGMSGGNGGGFR